jgi:poly(A) polymerase Pap1
MSIFTPGSAKNSTERINEITYDTISNELERGYQILGFQKDVEYLCQKADFINQFPLFIEIDICGKNLGKEQEKDYQDWQGSIEAKVLVLLSNILKYNKKEIESKKLTVVPNPKVYLKK